MISRNIKRILALDFGKKRVGVAISDPLNITAQPLSTIVYKNDMDLWVNLDKVQQSFKISHIVLGKPLNMDGSKSDFCKEVESFGKQLKKRYSVQVDYWDERLSSRVAENTLKLSGKSPSRNKSTVDKIAAIWFLQGYMDRLNSN